MLTKRVKYDVFIIAKLRKPSLDASSVAVEKYAFKIYDNTNFVPLLGMPSIIVK